MNWSLTKSNKLNTNVSNSTNKKEYPIWVKVLKNVGIALGLIFLILSFIRVPYVGGFIDSIFFSFLFGWTKYILYIVLFLTLILLWFPKLYKKIYTKRVIVLFTVVFWCIAIIITCIGLYVISFNSFSNFKNYFVGNPNGYITSWYDNNWLSINKIGPSPKPNEFGGIIALFIVSSITFIAPVIIFCVAIGLIVWLILWFLNIKNISSFKFKKNKKIISKNNANYTNLSTINSRNDLSKSKQLTNTVSPINGQSIFGDKTSSIDTSKLFSNTIEFNTKLIDDNTKNLNSLRNTELSKATILDDYSVNLNIENTNDISIQNVKKQKFDSLPKYNAVKKYLHYLNENIEYDTDINKLEENGVDYYPKLENELNDLNDKLCQYFQKNQLTFKLISKEIMYQSISVTYSFDEKNIIEWINNRIHDLLEISKNLIVCELSNNKIMFMNSYKEGNRPIVSLKDIMTEIGYNNPYSIAIGKQANRKSFFISAAYETNLIVYGGNGSGRAMLLSNMILSLSYLNGTQRLNGYIIDTTDKSLKHLVEIPQINNRYISSSYEALRVLNEINEEIKTQKDLFYSNNVNNIYDYNLNIAKNQSEIIKHRVLIINDINDIMDLNKDQFVKYIINILENSFNHGLIVILTSSIVNQRTIMFNNLMDNVIVLKVDNKEESINIIHSPGAELLCGNGDMLLTTDGKIYHLQMPFVNRSQSNIIIENIKQSITKSEDN